MRRRFDSILENALYAGIVDVPRPHRERLRGELTLAQIDRHSSELAFRQGARRYFRSGFFGTRPGFAYQSTADQSDQTGSPRARRETDAGGDLVNQSTDDEQVEDGAVGLVNQGELIRSVRNVTRNRVPR